MREVISITRDSQHEPLKNTVFVLVCLCWQNIPILHDQMIDFHHDSHCNIVDLWFPCFKIVFNQPHPGTSFLGIMHLQLVFFAVSVVMLSFMTISAQRCATIATPPIPFLRPTVGSVGSKIQTGPRVSQWLHAWCSQIQRWSEVDIKQIKLEISNSSDIRTNKNHKKERKRLEIARGALKCFHIAQRTSNIQIC